jgi:hypothetical protein
MRYSILITVLLIITINSIAQTGNNGLATTNGNIQLGGILNQTATIDQMVLIPFEKWEHSFGGRKLLCKIKVRMLMMSFYIQ